MPRISLEAVRVNANNNKKNGLKNSEFLMLQSLIGKKEIQNLVCLN